MRLELTPAGSGRTAVTAEDGTELARGHGPVICQAARRLIKRGHDPTERLEAFRGSTLCLASTIGAFAALTVEETTTRGPVFTPFRPFAKGQDGQE